MNPQTRPAAAPKPGELAALYAAVRSQTDRLAAPLSEADCQVQSMPDASPTRWHLAHVTWFFETFVLERHEARFEPFDPHFRVLFNSYYNGVGEQHPRAQRGLVTRPDLARVRAYRAAVDRRIAALLEAPHDPAVDTLVTLGLHHEQQHQELILTDLLHLLSLNPLAPPYQPRWPLATVAAVPQGWERFDGGLVAIGHRGSGFAFDNETPRHAQHLRPYALAKRLTTHGEWAAFVADGGYREPRWWLSAGWEWVRSQHIEAPLYWRGQGDGEWQVFTLHGQVALDPHTPITHISYYEADAFARWWSAQHPGAAPARLPIEAEWEHAAERFEAPSRATAHLLETGALHPMAASSQREGPLQLLGDVWEWTSSSYAPFPGFRAWDGAVGEYNAKFMVNQMVLRGGSCVTPRSHIRTSYRNFFPTDARWQFNGLRLAQDLD
jgi:ergothioneine biosynthesis protein EgtB